MRFFETYDAVGQSFGSLNNYYSTSSLSSSLPDDDLSLAKMWKDVKPEKRRKCSSVDEITE
ncbi:hypothetical protein Tcan_09251 [Toxocara canis]|uniref:Uncharacterized protein n=1 Tax=Toxocara canis TaxID=6265 RepID=A0A0B2VLK2_TOXCA|nr:hypothetical protein Tcan_09251 [Toxocara canis]